MIAGIEVNGTVPGSIYTDLYSGGVLNQGPLLYRFNDLDYRWVAYNDWTYSVEFNGKSLIDSTHLHLIEFLCGLVYSDLLDIPGQAIDVVLFGVDTVATVLLNGFVVGSTDNMFVRYKFDVKPTLRVMALAVADPAGM